MQARMDHAWMPRPLDHLVREKAARTNHGLPPLAAVALSSQQRSRRAGWCARRKIRRARRGECGADLRQAIRRLIAGSSFCAPSIYLSLSPCEPTDFPRPHRLSRGVRTAQKNSPLLASQGCKSNISKCLFTGTVEGTPERGKRVSQEVFQ